MGFYRGRTTGCILLLTTLLCSSAFAAECLPLKVEDRAGNYIIPGSMGEIVYRRIEGRQLALDAYVQRGGGRRPAVVIVHGGGWDTGSRRAFVGQMIETVTAAGLNWFSIDYRNYGLGRYEEGVDDLISAVEFIRCHAAEFGTDTRRIAILGEDSGAHLAAMAAAKQPGIASAIVLIGGFYDLSINPQMANRLPNRTADEAVAFLRSASPVSIKAAAFPATLVIHGTADSEAPPATARGFCDSLTDCRMIEVERAIHRPENWWPSQWGYKNEMAQWLKSRLGGESLVFKPYLTNPVRDIVYDAKNNLRLDAWRPSGKGPFPALILVHGGGWEAGDKVTYITPLFEPLARAGFAWFSIDYRLTPEVRHPQQLEDLRAAIRFVSANARRFNIDPRRIAVIGESASGQMVARLASEKLPELAAAVSFYGVYDFLPMARQLNPRSIPTRLFGISELDESAEKTLRLYSPLYHASADQTPMLLVCGNRDGLYAQHIAYVERLREVGARFDELTVEGAPHGVENWEGHPDRLGYKKRLIEWLSSTLSDGKRK